MASQSAPGATRVVVSGPGREGEARHDGDERGEEAGRRDDLPGRELDAEVLPEDGERRAHEAGRRRDAARLRDAEIAISS